jgi:hypothetical protein
MERNPSVGGSPFNVDYDKPQPTPPPGKYPTGVGQRYYGEFPGFVYDPYSDTYFPDPKSANPYRYSAGLAKKPPSTWSQLKSPAEMFLLAKGISDPKGLFSLPKNIVGGFENAGKELISSGAGALGFADPFAAAITPTEFLGNLGSMSEGLGLSAPEMADALGSIDPTLSGIFGAFGL